MKTKKCGKIENSSMSQLRGALNTKSAAIYLSVSESFLEKDRVNEARIPFCRIGKRGVVYRLVDLDNYLEKQLFKSTSDHSSGQNKSKRL